MGDNLNSIIMLIIMVVVVIVMAYFATILIAKRTNHYYGKKTVKLLEKTVLSPGLNITIIQVIDRVYILAINNKKVELVDIIEYDKWADYKKEQESNHDDSFDFFTNILSRKKHK